MKKIIGIYNGVTKDIQQPLSVFPVYKDGNDYFIKCESENLTNLLTVLKNLTNQKDIEEEIDAYINHENSLFSKTLLRYTEDSNYCYHLCSNTILTKEEFHPLEEFSIVNKENNKETYNLDTYAVIDYGKKLIVGSLDFVIKYVSEVTNLNLGQQLRKQNLIKKINAQLEIQKFLLNNRHLSIKKLSKKLKKGFSFYKTML